MLTAAKRFDPGSAKMAEERFSVLNELREESPVTFVPALGMWAVTGYGAVREVLADPQRFRSDATFVPSHDLPAESLEVYPLDGSLWKYAPVSSDGDEHLRLRKAIVPAFTARRVNSLEPVITADAQELLSSLFADGESTADLQSDFARPLPSRTIARFFGLPVEEAHRFSRWSESFVVPQVPNQPVEAYVAAARQLAEFDAYIRQFVTGDLEGVGDGIIRALVTGRREGANDLTEDELVGVIANVVFAGHETTVSTLSNVFARLLRERDLWDSLAAGTAEVGPLAEELLRLDTSGIGLFRVCTTDTRLAGTDLPAGAKLWVSYGAANRDPDAFPDPDTLCPVRARTADPVTFGHGIHVCVGTALARLQVRIAISAVPRAYPQLQLDGSVAEVPNFMFRATRALPVRC